MAAATLSFRAGVEERERARFANLVQSTSDRIQRRLDAYKALLRGASGLFAIQEEISLSEFRAYAERLRLHKNYPGTQGIGFSRRVSREELPAFEARIQGEKGSAGFQAWPVEEQGELYPIVYLEPLDARNEAALGYDMFSEPVRREAMERARDTGLPALSGKVTLKQEIDEDKQAGFLLYVPVYRGRSIPETVEARREALLGFVYSPFRARDLLEGIFGTERQPRVAFRLYDGAQVEPERLLYTSHPMEEEPSDPLLTTTTTLTVAGRPWTLRFTTLPAFEQTSSKHLVLPLGLVGVLVSLALFGMSLAQTRARGEAERRADELRVALTERARVEERLREADRRKDDFLAVLSHELRNPLPPMLTAVQLMDAKLKTGRGVDWERAVVERQVRHMARLVDDLLDVSRVTRGKIQLQKGPVEVGGAVKRVLEAARPLIESRGHTLRVELPSEPMWAEADPVRLEQVITNLLHNAAKYTEPGGHISLELTREEGWGVVRVVDTGAGIPAEALPRLFEPFMQVERTLDRAQGGLGLGLALVKSLVELHGGRVEAASEGPGKGSTFTVRLPLLPREWVPPQAPEQGQAQPRSTAGVRVLVVDDNVDAAEALSDALSLEGYEVEVAHDGEAALERARVSSPHVIFLDIGLPGLDGYEVARRLREQPGFESVRLVALTGYGQSEDRKRSREAGFDAHLVKPVDLQALRAHLPTGARE
jgi:signal transduction histidine kinase